MKAWASSSPEAMSTQVFCVTPDVPDAWAKRVEVGTALAATLAEHLDAASSGNTVAPWDLQEVRDSMIEHGHERDLAAPGGGSTQGLLAMLCSPRATHCSPENPTGLCHCRTWRAIEPKGLWPPWW